MSPLVHKSLTWSIVASVVLVSAWLADSVSDARESGAREHLVQRSPARVPVREAVVESPLQTEVKHPTVR
mgnify:CR=1 FL=1|jgi:hypothetical protein